MSCHYVLTLSLEGDVVDHIEQFLPKYLMTADEWEVCSAAILTTVAAAAPETKDQAARMATALTATAAFHLRAGYGCDPAVWLRSDGIDRFVLNHPDLAPHSIRTYRSTLRRIRRALVWMDLGDPMPARFHASTAPREPHDDSDLGRLRSWASSLPTAYQRRCAQSLLALGAGCGLAAWEIGQLRGRDATLLDSGTVIIRPPDSNRRIACRADWESMLAALVGITRPDQYFFAPERSSDTPENLIGNIVGRLQRSPGVPRLDTRRLRATWLVELMRERTPYEVIARAAGLASTEQLARYERWVPPVSEDEALRMLRGARWA